MKEQIEAGKLLTELMDKAKLRVVASFWLFEPEANEWRLVVSSPFIASMGTRAILRDIQKFLRQDERLKKSLDLRDIYVKDPTSELVKSLRSQLRTGKTIRGIRLTGNRIGESFVEDAYVYRAA